VSLLIRPARVEDSAVGAALLAETTGKFGVEVLGLGRAELQLKALQVWFKEKGNRFSHEVSTLAEKDGLVVGLLLAFRGAKLNALTLGCGRRIFHIYGIPGAIRMMSRNIALANNHEAEKDEYLVAHLAVEERSRRQGIGGALLEKAAQQAGMLGFRKLVLEVEIGNDRAIALYRKTGFEKIATVYFNDKQGRFKCPGFHKMLKYL